MILKSIRLSNIRSYANQEIAFPLGSTLLAGDIGAGKSSILLGIEFALFGLKKGEISSDSLLRHGSKEGSVELNFEISGKDVRVRRSLKRGKDDIKQEDGYLIVDGMKKQASAEELKSGILELLGYPAEFLKKKDLIYRYTVYTPQEEMKKIIYEDSSVRLDTIRKVFNIDKYRRIVDNIRILNSALREKKKKLEGFALDIERKKSDAREKASEIIELEKKISLMAPQLEEIKSRLSSKKESISKYEERISELNALKRDFHALESKLSALMHQKNGIKERMKLLDSQTDVLKKELEGQQFDENADFTGRMLAKEKEIGIFEKEYRDALRMLHSFKAKKDSINEAMEKILRLDSCSMCEQKVTTEHKHAIQTREGEKLRAVEKEIAECSSREKMLEEKLSRFRLEADLLRKEESKINVIRLKRKNLEDKKAERQRLEAEQKEAEEQIEKANSAKSEIYSKIEKMQLIEELYKTARQELDTISREERRIEIEKTRLERDLSSIQKLILMLEMEIKEKENALKELQNIAELEKWIDNFFVKLMSTIEKHTMHRLHSQFNDLFKEWLGAILEDESINAGLDDSFSPVIEQNGYETTVDNLSGGEKTSVALAYRLALNKVINDIVSEIKTKDLIILDEPTDGFSSEQLDKIRDVLNELNMKQVIIVSHESKIESYVNNVIRIGKNEHVSSIM